MHPTPTPSAHETISANLRLILRGILAVLGTWRVESALAMVLYGRIGRTFSRIERLLLRFRAGRLWRVTSRAATPRRQGCRTRAVAFPRKFGWLVIAGKHQAAAFGTQLQAVLNTPEMVELLEASPQAVRVLRPLCRALAVELPGSPERPRLVSSGVRKRRPRPKPEPFRIPLPRGVLSWARREGFGKLC